MGDYDIEIEIDADSGDIVWTHNGQQYYYTVDELEGKGVISQLLGGNHDITVYSQTETMSQEEYIEYMAL